MSKIIRNTLVLTIITVVAGLGLGLVYEVTKEPIARTEEQAKKEATEMAVSAGAIRDTVEIIEVEDVPLAYYAGNTNRVKIKAAGDLKA